LSGPRDDLIEPLNGVLYSHLMSIVDLEAKALSLPAPDRARLAEVLLQSLDELSAEENERLWAEEARRRDAEIDNDSGRARPAADVLRDARARLT